MQTEKMKRLMSSEALVCHRQINGESGGATVHCVVLADGFILECGSDGYAERRAGLLAEAINAYGPSSFSLRAMLSAAGDGR
jgi:hypothetical protein